MRATGEQVASRTGVGTGEEMDASSWDAPTGQAVIPAPRRRWVWLVVLAVVLAIVGAGVRAIEGARVPTPPPSGDQLGGSDGFPERQISAGEVRVLVKLPEEWREAASGVYRPQPPGGVPEELRVVIQRGSMVVPAGASNVRESEGRRVFDLPGEGGVLRAGVVVRGQVHSALVILEYAEGGVVDDAGAAELILESATLQE